MFGCIYKITNLITGKIYVGRYQYKRYTSFDNYWGSGTYIKRAIDKYGLENFRKDILEEAESNEELNACEISWISKLNATDLTIGYNLTTGGDCPEFTEEAKHRVSEAKKGKCPSKYKGVPRSEETRKKIGDAHRGVPKPHGEGWTDHFKETAAKRKALGLTKHSPETIEKIRQKKIERDKARTAPIIVSEETRQKLSKANKGKPKPPRSTEHSQHLREAKKGKPWSEARRAAQEARKNKGKEIAPENPDTQGE